MNQARLEIKVGFFVLLGLALLGALMLQFSKGATIFRSTYRLYLKSSNVGGLKPRAAVLISGVPVGTVSRIELDPDGKSVTIVLRIFRPYEIHKDARFVMEQSGFLGDPYVAVLPGDNKAPLFQDGDIASSEPPFNLQEVARAAGSFIRKIDETATRLNEAIDEIRRLVLNEATLVSFSNAVENLEQLSGEARGTVDRANLLLDANGPPIGLAISNVVRLSAELNQFAVVFGGALDTNLAGINVAVKNIEDSTAVLHTLLQDIEAGKGVAGSLIRNQTLATNVAEIVSNLSITSSNLNRLGLWGILWSRKPPRTNVAVPVTSPKHIGD